MRVRLSAPDLPLNHKIYAVLKTLRPTSLTNRRPYYWDAEAFNLQNSGMYMAMSPKNKSLVLGKISQELLREAYFIEKAGIAFAGKMIDLSETLQEREMYAYFASQEANHLNLLRPYIIDTEYEPSQFLEMISDTIESGDKTCLTLIVQILLEGYGLIHYKQLAVSCNDNTLVDCLNNILKDEAQHYRSGIALYDPNSLTEPQRQWVKGTVANFKDYVSRGPLRVVDAIQEIRGFTPQELQDLHKDINSNAQIQYALDKLDSLIGGLY